MNDFSINFTSGAFGLQLVLKCSAECTNLFPLRWWFKKGGSNTFLKDVKSSHVYSDFLKSFKATTSPTAFKLDYNVTYLPDLDISTMKQNNDKLTSTTQLWWLS